MEPTEPDALAVAMAGAVAEYGPEVVLKTWALFCAPFLPVTVVILRAGELHEQAVAHGLDPGQVEDAIALLGNLRISGKEHNAWLAAQLWVRHCADREKFLACAQAQRPPWDGVYKAPDHGKSELTMPGLSGSGAADETNPDKLED